MILGAFDVEADALVLRVDEVGIRELMEALRSGRPSTRDLVPAPAAKWNRAIRSLTIRITEGAVTVGVEGENATITGSSPSLAWLAQELQLFVEYNDLSEPGMHAHFDPDVSRGEKAALAPSSRSLVIAGPTRDD